jgi:hypothetical protein
MANETLVSEPEELLKSLPVRPEASVSGNEALKEALTRTLHQFEGEEDSVAEKLLTGLQWVASVAVVIAVLLLMWSAGNSVGGLWKR